MIAAKIMMAMIVMLHEDMSVVEALTTGMLTPHILHLNDGGVAATRNAVCILLRRITVLSFGVHQSDV